MSGDHSRRTYDPRRDIAGVFEQQGRVRVDADLNELVEVVDRRLRTVTMDVLHASDGRVLVPRETPDAFEIDFAAGQPTIGPGRAYVDGIQADNHGIGVPDPPLHFDSTLEELAGRDPIPYTPQPYLPNPPALPGQGRHLVYLDVWRRERTWAEQPELLDPALYGIDTATRRQVVWQVKVLADVPANVACDTPLADIPGWPQTVRPAAARLTTAAVAVPAVDDPCEVAPAGGFRGVTNRLYRVEVHDGGGIGQATFKWSRDNASLSVPVLAINGAALTVGRVGRDQTLRFATGDWVEVLDDDRELTGVPGEMATVAEVDEATGIVTLSAPLAGPFNVADPPSSSTRLRRWDQRGVAVGNDGVLTVGAAPVVLEDGVQVTFSLDPELPGGEFRPHEHWVFAARVADSSVELLDAAPPVGPHHHVGKLALVDGGAATVIQDCRVRWPPEGGGGDCGCDACVDPALHNSGAFTIQNAVDSVRATGGTVCLRPGVYQLDDTVRITLAGSVRIHGAGWRTIILASQGRPAFLVDRSAGITIEDLTVVGVGRAGQPDNLTRVGSLLSLLAGHMAIGVTNSVGVNIQRNVLITRPDAVADTPVVTLFGIVGQFTVRENLIVGSVGIGNVQSGRMDRRLANQAAAPTLDDHLQHGERGDPIDGATAAAVRRRLVAARLSRLLLVRSRITDNLIGTTVAAIATGSLTIHGGDHHVDRNAILTARMGTVHLGLAVGGTTTVRENTVHAPQLGIGAGLDGMRVADNDVFGFRIPAGEGETGLPAGIALVDGIGFNRPLEGARVTGNRVATLAGVGVLGRARVSTLTIDHNQVNDTLAAGIALLAESGGAVAVHDNVVERVGGASGLGAEPPVSPLGTVVTGIGVSGVLEADVRDNRVSGVTAASARQLPVGIFALSCRSSRIAGNTVLDTGDENARAFGIAVIGSFDRVDVVDDEVRRSTLEDKGPAVWTGVLIQGVVGEGEVLAPADLARGAAATILSAAGVRRFVFSVGNRPILIEAVLGRLERAIPIGRGIVAVRGTLVDGSSVQPLVWALARGHISIGDNRVVADAADKAPVVFAAGSSIIADANYIETGKGMHAVDLYSLPGAGTVLGNLSNGLLTWNGADIHTIAPWDALNTTG
jgi:hypothetical protein